MAFKIGFAAEYPESTQKAATCPAPQQPPVPRKSLAEVQFPERNTVLTYYNDQFDLHRGDWVYVDGKLEGQRGRVKEVNYHFKIKRSDYKRIISVADTAVHGSFFSAGSHFVTFDPLVLPVSQVTTWFMPPEDDDEYATGSDGECFQLNDLKGLKISGAIAERGHNYYLENKVRYLRVDETRGRAIVEGTRAYEVEFTYRKGEISDLTCSCFCNYHCKHEFAVLLQLRETLDLIEQHYADEYERTGCFTAVDKGTLFSFAVDGKEDICFTL